MESDHKGPSSKEILDYRSQKPRSARGSRGNRVVQEGQLFKKVTGLTRIWKRQEWCEQFFRLDSERGVFDIWASESACKSKLPAEQSFSLDHLLIVAQPKGQHRVLQLVFGGRACRGKKIVDLRIPEDCDFHSWFSALAREARATGDV